VDHNIGFGLSVEAFAVLFLRKVEVFDERNEDVGGLNAGIVEAFLKVFAEETGAAGDDITHNEDPWLRDEEIVKSLRLNIKAIQ